MALLIGFESRTKLALSQLDEWPDCDPDQTAFWLPDEAAAGNRVLWYIGGTLNKFVALGRTTTEWKKARSGKWNGIYRMGTTKPRLLMPFVAGEDVARVCGLPVPKDCGIVPAHLERQVLAFVQGKPIDPSARALEGGMTEARSRKRNPVLRSKAHALANGVCSCCGTDFKLVGRGLGQRCLVVHHKRQVRDYDDKEETKLSDLAVVCANCHMLIHANPDKALTVAQARLLLTPKSTRG